MSKKNTKTLQAKFESTATLEMNVAKLKQENRALKETVSKLLTEINRLKDIDVTKVTKLRLTPEDEICELQIQQLNAISRERKLTLEEVKTLDLLIKNKRLINEKSTSNNDITLPPNMSEDELMRIAESVEEEKEGDK